MISVMPEWDGISRAGEVCLRIRFYRCAKAIGKKKTKDNFKKCFDGVQQLTYLQISSVPRACL